MTANNLYEYYELNYTLISFWRNRFGFLEEPKKKGYSYPDEEKGDKDAEVRPLEDKPVEQSVKGDG